MRLDILKLVLLFTAVLFSCNTTKVTSSWKAENTVTKKYHNIMIWGILTEKDSPLRQKMELHLVNDLTEKGYHSISSMEVYGTKAFKKLTEKEIVDEFKNSGVDAVITLVLLSKEKEEVYVPPSIINTHESIDRIDKYYSTVYDKIFTPGYYVSTMNYYWESSLFEVAADKLVYTVKTKSFDPANTEILAHENGTVILKDMAKKRLIIDLAKPD